MNAPEYPEEIRTLVADIGFEIGGDARVWELVERVERAHARELAEKIRNSCPCYVDPDSGCGDAECVGKMDAADLIDPDVEK